MIDFETNKQIGARLPRGNLGCVGEVEGHIDLVSALDNRSWLNHISGSEGQVVLQSCHIQLLLKCAVLRDGAIDVAEVL